MFFSAGFLNGVSKGMQGKWQNWRRVWQRGLLGPGLLLTWSGVILALGGLRWLGTQPGWTWWSGLLVVVLIGLVGRLLRLLNEAFTGQTTGSLYWRDHGVATIGLMLMGLILALPWGLWGLSSRLLARLPLPALWVNWVGLNRRPVLGVVAIIYLFLLAWGVLWGPRHLKLTPVGRRGRLGQMLGAVIVQALLLLGWLLVSLAVIWLNRRLVPATPATLKMLTGGSMLLILLGYTGATMLGLITLAWSWCGRPRVVALPSRERPRWYWWVLGLCWLGVSGLVVSQAVHQPDRFGPTLLISHRGVDHERGVQNTLGALRTVHHERPAYVEMDLHETKDQHWVVLHDENLRQLAGRRQTPRQLTSRQLAGLTVHENGQSDRLVTWPEYLRVAEALKQPLLVELKTTPQDSPGMVRQFAEQYGARLSRDGSAVHSLDYRVVAQLRHRVPGLRVGYITPFNWVAPKSVPADFYSFQRLSVSDQFIAAAHQAHVPAYLWTPDSVDAMTRLWALGADGQITNELSRLRRVVNGKSQSAWWAVLMNFTLSYI